jgi:methylglutaconyl-CoA hydratase
MSYNTITLSYEDRVALLTLNRPDKRNAISFELVDEVLHALAEVEKSSALVLVITGAGKAFSGGLDLENLKGLIGRTPEQNVKDTRTMAQLFRTIYDFPKPTIAAVNGAAIAGGTGMATLCDFTIASTEAKFGYTEVRIGFIPAIVSSFLVRQVGEKQARDLLLTGRIFDAAEAYRIGLINEVVEPERLMSRVKEIVGMLLENSPISLLATKKLINSFESDELGEQIESGILANAQSRTTKDFREGVTAFLEKRKPAWSGQ